MSQSSASSRQAARSARICEPRLLASYQKEFYISVYTIYM